MTESEYRRRRNLPGQLERARLRVLHLEREAERYGMTDLLTERYRRRAA